jgi:hypothetical protein
MTAKDLVLDGIERVKKAISRPLDGLSQSEIAWKPGPEANCIGFILLHTARTEDSFVNKRLLDKPQVWESGRWFEKLNLPVTETGSGYTREQLVTFNCPDIGNLMAYMDAVQAQTVEYVKQASCQELERKVTLVPSWGEIPVASAILFITMHAAQHAGEISYIRGLQRGLNR